jgi:hypothetical protein
MGRHFGRAIVLVLAGCQFRPAGVASLAGDLDGGPADAGGMAADADPTRPDAGGPDAAGAADGTPPAPDAPASDALGCPSGYTRRPAGGSCHRFAAAGADRDTAEAVCAHDGVAADPSAYWTAAQKDDTGDSRCRRLGARSRSTRCGYQ